ncbi:Cu(I)-responsive transcriptional regulator [Bartonella sp. LJL80]
MNIGEAAKQSGLTAKMIRHYEEIGLIAPAHRSDSGYRVYMPNDIANLRFVRRSRALGFSIEDIRLLLELWKDRSRASSDVKKLALSHVKMLEEKMAALQAMVDTLNHLAHNCHGDDRPDCPILEDLAGCKSCH